MKSKTDWGNKSSAWLQVHSDVLSLDHLVVCCSNNEKCYLLMMDATFSGALTLVKVSVCRCPDWTNRFYGFDSSLTWWCTPRSSLRKDEKRHRFRCLVVGRGAAEVLATLTRSCALKLFTGAWHTQAPITKDVVYIPHFFRRSEYACVPRGHFQQHDRRPNMLQWFDMWPSGL